MLLSKLLAAFALMALCVVIHALGVMTALRWVGAGSGPSVGFLRSTWRFVRLAGWMILAHLVEITAWAWFYAWKQAMPDLQSAIYFSAATYTTVGYGDLVLPVEWRLVGGVEALTGILMCGWSTGFFFAIVSRMFEARTPTTKVTP
jgi:voltage-gated potassium channel Kch